MLRNSWPKIQLARGLSAKAKIYRIIKHGMPIRSKGANQGDCQPGKKLDVITHLPEWVEMESTLWTEVQDRSL